MSDREILKRAMREVIGFAAARYLISNMAGRENGAEKAQRHLEMSKAFVTVWMGDAILHYRLVQEVHDRTASELTNHLPEAIGFDRGSAYNEETLQKFIDRFFAIAADVLDSQPESPGMTG